MFVFSVLIERSVEVHLIVIRLSGDDRFAPEHKKSKREATRSANIAAITWSILVALAGVRLMSTLAKPIYWLAEDKIWNRKKRHTAKRVLERRRDEHGFSGGYTISKDYLRETLGTAFLMAQDPGPAAA